MLKVWDNYSKRFDNIWLKSIFETFLKDYAQKVLEQSERRMMFLEDFLALKKVNLLVVFLILKNRSKSFYMTIWKIQSTTKIVHCFLQPIDRSLNRCIQ